MTFYDVINNGNPMILGLDVGGTQTDAVLINQKEIVAETKIPTGNDLLETLKEALENILVDVAPNDIERMVFSTTLATNTIVQNRLQDAGMIVSAGPGMDPLWSSVGPSYHVVEGCLDHRGIEVLPLNKDLVLEAAARIKKKGINVLGIVGKFSVRNPVHELQAAKWVGKDFSHVALGHQVSGSLNFPRRIATTYLNAALYELHQGFVNALIRILKEKNLHAPRYLLKPEGGTARLEQIMNFPAQTAQSGPAASVMGALALDGCAGTPLVLDIGGTTTDMGVVLDGAPLLDPQGITLGQFRTLIRSLLTCSIGVGGDSEVCINKNGGLKIGPLRKGRAVAFGGPVPTPTDALITLDLLKAGDKDAARDAMEKIGGPMGWDVLSTAERVLRCMAQTIADAANSFIRQINSWPVYTIHELIEGRTVAPAAVVVIGGPAPYVAPYIGEALGLPHRVPSHFGVANAVGAAAARVTSEITLQADTERGTVVIPEANLQNRIDHSFDIDDALALARKVLKEHALQEGAEPEAFDFSITEQQVFNMVRGYSRTGKNIRLKLSITPGLMPGWDIRSTER